MSSKIRGVDKRAEADHVARERAARAAAASGTRMCGVVRDTGPLWLKEAPTGMGNRLGVMLTVAALGNALNRTVVIRPVTNWSTARRARGRGGRKYSDELMSRAVHPPDNVRMMSSDESGVSIFSNGYQGWLRSPWWLPPQLPMPYLYVPELSWEWLRVWASPATFRSTAPASGVFEIGREERKARLKHRDRAPSCLERSVYLASYRAVQRQLRPGRLDLTANPRPRSYLVLHLRHSRSRADRAEGNISAEAWSKIEAIARATQSKLPWLVLSDVRSSFELAERRMLRAPEMFSLVPRPEPSAASKPPRPETPPVARPICECLGIRTHSTVTRPR
jgi:hypothetical protein